MKTLRTLYMGIAAAVLCSCIQEVRPEGQHVSGMWAIVNEQSQTTSYLKFEDGYLTVFSSDDSKTVADGKIWHSAGSDFSESSRLKYSLSAEGQLFLGGKYSCDMKIDGDSMTYGKQNAVAVSQFSPSWYSKITTSVSDNVIKEDLLAHELVFDYAVESPIPNASLSAVVSPGDMATVRISKEGKMTVVLPEVNKASTSTITLTYPGAQDLAISLVREAATTISLTQTAWEYDYTGQSVTIPFTVSNLLSGETVKAVLGSEGSDWIKNITVGASSLSFRLEENNDSSSSQREASITLSTKGALDVKLQITQHYSAPSFTYSPSSLSTDYTAKTGQSFKYTVVNPREGGSVMLSCSSSWISNLKDNNGTVTFDIAENNSGSSRSASITTRYSFGGYSITKSFTVSQTYSAMGITFSPASQTTDYIAKNLSFTYAISNPRQGATASASTTDAWITDVQLSGTTVNYKVTENNSGASRTGKIKLTYGSVSKEFSVTQTYTASVITCDPSSQSTDYTAKSLSFTATVSNLREGCSLAASTTDTWITNVQLSGTTVSYRVSDNDSGASRIGVIKLTYGSVSKDFSVTQTYSAVGITLSPVSQVTDYTAKSLSFTYSVSNPREGVTASATTTDSWITNVQVSGATVSYKVSENNSGASRTGKIRLTYGSVSKEFSVTQTYTAPKISFSPTSEETGYTAKSLSFTYSVDTPRQGVTASVSTADTWITDVTLSGTTVSYKVAENNSGAQRTGKIRLSYGSTYKDFSVTQAYTASVITCDPSSQSTDYTAKSLSFTYAISNPRDGVSASASTTASWISYVLISGTTVSYKVAENNSGASRTGKIKLTYGTVSKEFSVTQSYTAPVISFTPASQSTDYTAKSLSFTYSVDTPRQGVTASATTTDSWITNVQVSGATVSYKVSENNSGASRTGKIKLTYGTVSKEFLVIQSPEPYNGHEYVDLGLSVKWATCNVGASKPEDYGGYYQWAGTEDVKGTRINLDPSNCPYHTGSSSSTGWTKYVPSARSSYWSGAGSPDNKSVLDPGDDVASVKWKGTWRMPTDSEWTELRNTSNCSWTWTTINGINGYKVQSRKSGYTDNWIFLPAAGYRSGGSLVSVGSSGYYWSSSLYTDYPNNAYRVYFTSDFVSRYDSLRYNGLSVRPVSK